MARNLSKISAVISVNTAEARQKLAGFAGDAKKYAKSLDASFQRTSTRIQQSFEKIFTEQQKVQRAIQAGLQAGVDPKVIRTFADTKALEQEANKIEALRKRALGMTSASGQREANAEVDRLAAVFTKLNDKLARTGKLSREELDYLRQMVAVSGQIRFTGITDRDRRKGYTERIEQDFSRGANTRFFEEARLAESVRQLTAYRNIMRQIGATAGGPIADAFGRLRNVQAKSAAETDPKKLEQYRKEIERLRVELEKLIAAEAKRQGGRSRNLTTPSGIRNQVDRLSTGFMTSDWGTRTGLAIQQMAFAFDDFNSATGGLDQKIRAMGNNISQLGLMAGGTAGLIGGVLFGATMQLYASYLKLSDATADTAAITKAAAKAEQELVAARQKQADVLKDIRHSLATSGMSEEERREFDSTAKGGEFLAGAVEEQRAKLMRDDPVLRRVGARIAQLEKQMENPNMGAAERRKIEQQIDEQRGLQEQRLSVLRGPTPQDALGEFRKLEAFYNEMGGETGYLDYLKPMVDKVNQAIANGMGGLELDKFVADAVANAVPDPGMLPRSGLTEMMIDYLDSAAAAASANLTRRRLEEQTANADMIPVFDQAAGKLNSVRDTVAKEFEGMIPQQYLATIADIREEMMFVEQQLADGAITAEEAAAEMEVLNSEMSNVERQAGETASALRTEAKARDLLADMAIDAWNREQEAKKRFYEESDMFAFDRGMDRVREFSLGARQTDGVSDDQAAGETLQMIMREFAPAIMQMLAAQQNALLQGLSRKPLQMQDVSTSGGMAEYARLIAGEDSAKNADLAELRKQSKLLGELVEQGEQEGII